MTHWCLALSLTAIAFGQVRTDELPDTHETAYRITVDTGSVAACTLSWTLSRTALNRKVAQQRVGCPTLPFTSLLTGVDQIITSLQQREPDRLAAIDTLFLGNLSSYPEIAGRLALLVALSKDWDPMSGRPRSGATVAFIERIAKQPALLAGLDQIFRRHGIQIEFSSVENVGIARASVLPSFEDLERNGVRPESRIPANCLVWIRLIHLKGASQQP